MSISLTRVTKAFDAEKALDGISLDIKEGEFFAVLGPSGCGKSTLLRLVAGLESLDDGEIIVAGKRVAGTRLHVAPEARDVGVVFQSYALWPHMSVEDNVGFPLEAAGARSKAARLAAQEHLRTVELEDYAKRKPAHLSGGQRQRVALARCLAQGANTILMDEPLANLDPHLRASMEEELARFHAATNATILYITHDQREAMALADRIAVMWHGHVLQVGKPSEIYRRPASELVARFIGRSTIFDGDVLDVSNNHATVRIGPLTFKAEGCDTLATGPARIVIRPEDVIVADGPDAVTAISERTIYRGGLWEVSARIEGVAPPVALALPRPAEDGEKLPVTLRGGWVLPQQH